MSTTRTILLVDDNSLNRRLVIAILTGLPLTVVQWDNGYDALDYLVSNGKCVDLVLLDIGMPGMSGTDICTTVRSSPDPHLRNLPMIAYTAHAMQHERELYLRVGFNDVLVKPVTKNDLLYTVDKYLPIRQEEKERHS